MIVDCFTFFNELETLELRLSLLDAVIDRFVLCESPFTFRGDPKPLVFAENRAHFARWNERIVHLIYDVPPDSNPWVNEWGQRAHLTSALGGLAPDDLILIGDVDEMPAPEHVGRRPRPGRVLAHRHLFAVGYVNRVRPNRWVGTKTIAYGDLGTRTLNDVRAAPREEIDVIEGGWHFSGLGGAHIQSTKIRAFSHAEFDIPYLTDERRLAVQSQSETDASWVPLDARFPALLHEARWTSLVWSAAPCDDAGDARTLVHAHGCYGTVPPNAGVVGALSCDGLAVWQRAGSERYGARFAGAHRTVAAALATLPPDGWIIIDGLAGCPPGDLGRLAAHGCNAVVFARNTRWFAVVRDVMAGQSFPMGPALGLPELQARIEAAGYTIERRDDVVGSIFPPALFEQPEPFDAVVGALSLHRTTRQRIYDFSTSDYLFTCVPVRRGAQ